jgi:hypothetical protein
VTTAEFELLTVLTALLGFGTFSLIGLRMFLNYRVRRLSAGAGSEQIGQLSEAVDDLRRDLADTRADLADIHERVDFAERLLTRARDEGRLPS